MLVLEYFIYLADDRNFYNINKLNFGIVKTRVWKSFWANHPKAKNAFFFLLKYGIFPFFDDLWQQFHHQSSLLK